jgi:hypothetical protein
MIVSLFIHWEFQFLISGCISTTSRRCYAVCSCLGTHLFQNQGFFVIQCELAMIIEKIFLWKWCHMIYQCDGAPQYFTQIITHYLNQQFCNQGIICGSAQNWPLWWKDWNLLDNHVWGYVHAVMYTCKLYMGELLLWRFLNAAGHKLCCSSLWSYTFSGHMVQKMYPSRWRQLWTICMSSDQC